MQVFQYFILDLRMGGNSLLGQATCNSRVGPLMSLEKDFVGGGANTGATNTLSEEKSQS